MPLFGVNNVTVRNITCECGNGLAACVWPPGSVAGHRSTTSNVLFSGAKMIGTSMAVVIKSLASFEGEATNVL